MVFFTRFSHFLDAFPYLKFQEIFKNKVVIVLTCHIFDQERTCYSKKTK